MRKSSLRLIAAALASASIATSTHAQKLQTKAGSAALSLKQGINALGDRNFAYVPRSVGATAPLLVLLPGRGQDAGVFMEEFTSEAERRGAILLAVAPAAEGGSWTLKPAEGGGADFGTDPARIDAALRTLFASAPIDPGRTAIVGFSDGASYALSIGLANPELFKGIVALSPGTVWLAGQIDPEQKLYIVHGRRDTIFPVRNTRDTIVPGLEKAGLKPQLRLFNADHEIDRRSLGLALDYVLGQ